MSRDWNAKLADRAAGTVPGFVGNGQTPSSAPSAPIDPLGWVKERDLLATAIPLPPSTGIDDTAMVNAFLSVYAGKLVKGIPGETYRLSSPFVLASDTTLDMTGCTVLHVGTSGNMLTNAATTPVRTLTDVTISLSTPTNAYSPSGAFTSADVGRSIRIDGAAVGATPDRLVTKINAVVDGQNLTLADPALTAVSNASTSIYNRDKNITVVGGRWDRQAVGPGGGDISAHCLLFRHVDGLNLIRTRHASTNGKYAISLGDVTSVKVMAPFFDGTKSDGVHIAGPSNDIYVGNASGTTGDDMVAITTQEPGGFLGYNDTLGPVSNVVFENISPTNGGSRGVLLCAGQSGPLTNVKVRNLSGNVLSQPGVIIGTGAASAPGLHKNITLENVSIVTPSAKNTIEVVQSVTNLTIDGIQLDDANKSQVAVLLDSQPHSNVILRNIQANSGGHIVQVAGTTVIDHLAIDCAQFTISAAGVKGLVTFSGTPTLKSLALSNIKGLFTTGSCYMLSVFATAATIGRISVNNLYLENTAGGGGLISATGTSGVQTIGPVDLTNVQLNKLAWLVDTNIPIEIHCSSVSSTNPTQGIANVRATGDLTMSVAASNIANGTAGSNSGLAITAGGVVRSNSLGFKTDVSKLVKIAGATAFNTNAALSCGFGPVVSDGSLWKNLFSGATY